MANVLEGNEYKSYIMAILASALFSEDTKVPVTLTDYIYDPTLGKFQNEINAEVSDPKTVTVFVFKSTANETDPNATPNPPTGGSWDMTTDILQLPEGWTTNDELDAPVWLSYGVFGVKNDESTLIQEWSTPVRISGKDGIDGKDGNGYTYIYSRTENSDTTPTWIENWTIDQALAQGWVDSPSGITETLLAEWVAILPNVTEENPNPTWQGPVLWSKWGVNGKDGDGVEYIYCLSTGGTPSINHLAEDNQQKREYVPKGETGTGYSWTDSPSGVTEEIKYEWVSIRKLNHETQIWGDFNSPKLWAKYGETGPSGMSVWIAYNDNKEKPSEKPSNNPLELGNGWYFAEDISSSNDPIWWCLKRSQTIEGGTWGPVLKLNGQDGTSVNIKNSLTKEDDLCSIENPTLGDGYIIGDNLYVCVQSEATVNCANGSHWKNVGTIKGPQGIPGVNNYIHVRYADEIVPKLDNEGKEIYVDGILVTIYKFTIPDGSTPGRYFGSYVSNFKIYDEDPNIGNPNAYTWFDTKGEQGVPGAASEFYTLSANTNVVVKKSNGGFEPVNIIPYIKHVKGNVTSLLTAVPEGYMLYYWNNNDWTTYTDLGEGLGIPVKDLLKIKFKLERDSDDDNQYELVDELNIPIVADGSDAYTIIYSDQNVAIECDYNGTPVDLNPIDVTIKVMKGSSFINIKSDNIETDKITITINPNNLNPESMTTIFSGTLELVDGTELSYSINAIKVQPGTPAQNPIYIQASQTSVLYECGIEPESEGYYLKSPTRAVELTFTLYEGQNQVSFSTEDTNMLVDLESLSEKEIPNIEKSLSNNTLTVTIPNLVDENLESYGDFKIIVSDTYNNKDVSAEVYVDFYIQEGVITKPLVAFTKTNDDISKLSLTGLDTKETYTLPISEGYTWYSNTDIDDNGQLWKAEGLAEIRKTSTETTYDVTWYLPYILLDNDSREIIYTDLKVKDEIPKFADYGGGPTEKWFIACNSKHWYDDTVDSNSNTFEAMWMATNDKKSNLDWSDDNWVFSLLYNDNITYKIVTDLPSQPAPGEISFTVEAIKTVNGVKDETFDGSNCSITVEVGSEPLSSNNNVYTHTFVQGEVVTITLKVNGSLQDIYTATVTIGELGPEGASNYSIEATPDTIYVNVDNNSKYVLEDVSQSITFRVLKGGVIQDLNNWALDATDDTDGYYLSSITKLGTSATFNIGNIESGDEFVGVTSYIDIFATYGDISISKRINVVSNSKGDPGDNGEVGETGPIIYPAGYLELGKAYSVETENGKILAQPFFYYQKDGNYYVLQTNITETDNTATNVGQLPWWRPFTKIQYLFTEALMTNWAKLASATFWGDYMFSQYGLKDDLTKIDALAFSDEMFTNGRLNGTITPNLFLDFLSGMIKTNKLSETFVEFNRESTSTLDDIPLEIAVTANEIDPSVSYNIKVTPNKYTSLDASSLQSIPLISMPQFGDVTKDGYNDKNNIIVHGKEWEPDGMRCSILVKESAGQNNIYTPIRDEIWNGNLEWLSETIPHNTLLSLGVIITADAMLFNQYSYKMREKVVGGEEQPTYSPTYYQDPLYLDDNIRQSALSEISEYGNFFVVGGRVTKFLIVEPGTVVQLRSCATPVKRLHSATQEYYDEYAILWYVENSNDFSEIEVQVNFTGKTYGGYSATRGEYTFSYGNYGTDDYHNRVFGTKTLKKYEELAKEKGIFEKPILSVKARENFYDTTWTDNIESVLFEEVL